MRKKKNAPETASEQDQLSAVVDTLAKQKQGAAPAPKPRSSSGRNAEPKRPESAQTGR